MTGKRVTGAKRGIRDVGACAGNKLNLLLNDRYIRKLKEKQPEQLKRLHQIQPNIRTQYRGCSIGGNYYPLDIK